MNSNDNLRPSDWRCPACKAWHRQTSHICKKCGRPSVQRMTKAKLLEKRAEAMTAYLLRKHGL